jgi:hypothetical protein
MLSQIPDFAGVDNGASFYKVDLHFHTPASHDYKDRSVRYERLVEKALEAGLNMVAVTDHNTGAGFDEMTKTARNSPLVVLPGVEITVENIHLLAIFPENSSCRDVTFLLHNLKIKDNDFGKKETICSVELSIANVLEEIEQAGGIGIAAHTGSERGMTEEIRGVWRQKLVQHPALKVIELTKHEDIRYFDGTDPVYKRKFSCVMGSDAHHPDEIGRRATWIRMGDSNFRSLKQIVCEPQLRISLTQPRNEPYPRIVGMSVTGGLYEGETFHFNNNLNCLIGGRGAGKSAVIDFIRYALNYPPRSEDYLREFNERIVKLLEVGSCVKVVVDSEDGRFLVERKLLEYDTEKVSGKQESVSSIQSEHHVFQIINGQLVESPEELRQVFEIEVFGQGEVFELTRRADDQLKLIDEYIGADDLFSREEELMSALGSNAERVIALDEEVRGLMQQLDMVPELDKKIVDLEERLKEDIFKKHALWQQEGSYFTEIEKELAAEKERIETAVSVTVEPQLPSLPPETPSAQKIEQAEKLFKQFFSDLATSRHKQLDMLQEVTHQIEQIRKLWHAELEKAEEEFNLRLAELGVSDQKALSTHLNDLKDKKSELERKIKPAHDKKVEELKQLRIQREELLKELEETRENIHSKRAEMVGRMSAALEKGDVKIEINKGANRRDFFAELDRIYAGSGIQKRKEQLERVCTSITPRVLADILQNKEFASLVEQCKITEDAAKKIIYTVSACDIYNIQSCPTKDELVIYLRKAMGENFSPLKDLSYGEKCTAVFSIGLLGKKKPLLVDQPEDELDHAFIINNIVEHIRGVKETRQLIIATHNANIPVLGDAELILKVAKVPGVLRCKIEDRGAFEKESIIERLQDLEGGKEAFKRRRQKYGIET